MYSVHSTSEADKDKGYATGLNINRKTVEFQLDTGSTIVNEYTY